MTDIEGGNVKVDDLFGVSGKTVVVTGGSRGIGLMIARGFVENGARVYVSSRNADACNDVAAELSKTGECVAIPADLGTMAGVEHLAAELSSREGAINVLINNAGTAWGAPLEEFPESGFDKVWDLNVKGLFFMTVRLLPLLRKAATADDPARVINIGSIDGIRVPKLFENFSYSAAKAGVHMLSRHLAQQLVAENITVNAIAPGLFPSKMTKLVFDNAEEAAIATIPLHRAGRADDMAGTAIFLSSRAGSYLTGAVIAVDGGVTGLA